jgi:aldehyde dehydrogenase (NAD+)
MYDFRQFYIDGAWINPTEPNDFPVINPANAEVTGQITLGAASDVDYAVAAARQAFDEFSKTTREECVALRKADYRIPGQDLGSPCVSGI